MKQTNKKRKGILGKLVAGATAGATVGLATYLYLKNDKVETHKKVEDLIVAEDSKADLFV
ncbi:hypothetical protein SAMN04488029_3060 [Reichenbachiella faecimaris]|uniref:Uncharacterized protein n=1 Tax=Reichenbachiella faecimaris TaxID=692418 RepID=A0A1W2GKI9_REIFA|nr:hypothetical protein [Reichenbachiella faecimaris]SMD36776.1 hypothetical protein SAMN04488029_3060 [Reichenbachiella faecimaris]